MAKSAQRQWLISISGITGYFSTKQGGDRQADVSEVWDGGSLTPDLLSGPSTTANITVGRAFQQDRDMDLLTALRQQVGKLRATITVQAADADLVAVGSPTVYSDCLLVRVGEPQANAAQSDAATFELEWKPRYVS